jgi:chromosomal replication initiation ATPase DnaA
MAMYLAHIMLGLSLTEVGDRFGRDRTTVAHACARVEDGRDDPVFDAAVTRLEAVIADWQSPIEAAVSGLRHAG